MLAMLAGCASLSLYPEEAKGPILTSSLEELKDRINNQAEALKGLSGSSSINFLKPGMEKSRQCEGKFFFDNKAKTLRIEGYATQPAVPFAPAERYFTLIARDGKFWIDLPSDKVVYTGDIDLLDEIERYEMRIRPNDMLKAVVTQELPAKKGLVFLEETGDDYLLTVYEDSPQSPLLKRKIWIERRGFRVIKEVYYSKQGFVELEIEKSDYLRKRGVEYPQYIQLLRTRTAEMVSFYFKDLKINPDFGKNIFVPEERPGFEVVTIDKGE